MLIALLLPGGMPAAPPAASAEGPAIVISRPQHNESKHGNTGVLPLEPVLQGIALTAGKGLRAGYFSPALPGVSTSLCSMA